ncbi:DUF5991 domain-containing protein [Lewinella cohaerens]|uniref:DUF5991 domain-containing protein n=1 Tax=Lewinella cohaerens TaxID=70995 RepID=UPI0003614997|nr:DUF5991 domain-containing protein [Lewinella cohaerens]
MNRLFSFSLFCLLSLFIVSCEPATSTTENTDDAATEELLNNETAAPSEDAQVAKTTIKDAVKTSWMGTYLFNEGANGNFWGYELQLNDQLKGTLFVDGFQTMQRLKVAGIISGNTLKVNLVGYDKDNLFEQPAIGSELFMLEQKDQQLITHWGSLEPNVIANNTVGSAFEKVRDETSTAGIKLLITSKSFVGIQPGDKITDHQTSLQKDMLETGEGDFEIYQILDQQGTAIGYLHPDPNDEQLVGMIVVTSPEAKTEDGLSVGMTLGDLREKLTGYEIHGSEIEGYTAAYHGPFSYQLDSYNWEYDLDASKIADDVKIIEITLRD